MICNLKRDEASLSILSLSYKRKINNLSNINKQIGQYTFGFWSMVTNWAKIFNLHNIVFYFDEEFFHGKNVFCNIERPHGDQKRCIIQADKFSQDFSA